MWEVKSHLVFTVMRYLEVSFFPRYETLLGQQKWLSWTNVHLAQLCSFQLATLLYLTFQFSVSTSFSCILFLLCCTKHNCLSFISPWSDSDNAESAFVSQYVLTLCLCGITPSHPSALFLTLGQICFCFSDRLIALRLINN